MKILPLKLGVKRTQELKSSFHKWRLIFLHAFKISTNFHSFFCTVHYFFCIFSANKEGGEEVKTWKSWANILFECPLRIINGSAKFKSFKNAKFEIWKSWHFKHYVGCVLFSCIDFFHIFHNWVN